MANVIILASLALICVYSVYSYWKKLRHGGGCCGEDDAPEKRLRYAIEIEAIILIRRSLRSMA